ncbi:MAG: ABC transporter ATP-binding protein [Firmicutes bacterium]|nr:ABC transporter ATP-binding protein [Bacillota bacterium]
MKVLLSHLTKRFPNINKKIKTEVTAVSDFDIEIPDGKLIGLLGPSGCGKSTLLNLISGLEQPSEGKVFFGDEDVTELPPEKRGIGLVFQNYALYPHLTALQNIMFPLENLKGDSKMAKEDIKAKAIETAKLVQIEDYLDRKPSELSGGQQQRVAIARALVKTPNVLLLDEPLSNLDARLRLQTREEIKRIQQETGVTTIFVTHDQDEAMSISDYIVVMKAGVFQQMGKPQDVYDDPDKLFVAKFLGVPPVNVFKGRVQGGKLILGDDAVLNVSGLDDRDVYVGIRPEGYLVEEDGLLHCGLNAVEVQGRDTSIIATHPAADEKSFRAIVIAEYAPDPKADHVNLNIKPNKVYLFDTDTEERLRCELFR